MFKKFLCAVLGGGTAVLGQSISMSIRIEPVREQTCRRFGGAKDSCVDKTPDGQVRTSETSFQDFIIIEKK